MRLDSRLEELYTTDRIVHAGIDIARHNKLSETEMLTEMVIALSATNKTLTAEMVRMHSKSQVIL